MEQMQTFACGKKSENAESVGNLFNDMSDHYDLLDDLWFSFLFSRLHYMIAKDVIVPYNPRNILDIGCGTGFQSFLHAAVGAQVIGIDLSSDLLKLACQKSEKFDPHKLSLFPSKRAYKKKYDQKIKELLQTRCPTFGKYVKPRFQQGDACNLNFPDNSFDHINCAGSVISFIPDYIQALKEMYRVLQPGGTAIIELESKWNQELLWLLPSWLLKEKYVTHFPWQHLKKFFKSPFETIKSPYSYCDETGKPMQLNQFTRLGLTRELNTIGFQVLKTQRIHSYTNLIPSRILCRETHPKWIENLFLILSRIEEAIPYSLLSSSFVFIIQKQRKI
jgi:ubiquinone/menaquinone biosynthesis C-methylase UbiE